MGDFDPAREVIDLGIVLRCRRLLLLKIFREGKGHTVQNQMLYMTTGEHFY